MPKRKGATPRANRPAPAPGAARVAAESSETAKPWWKKLGPGLITGAADDDPSGIATYSQGGAQFGYGVAWTVLLTYPLMVAIQLASARIGRVTGKGLTENFYTLCPRPVVYGLVALLVVANVINLGADLNAMGDATRDADRRPEGAVCDRLRHRLAAAAGLPALRALRQDPEVADAVSACVCRRRPRRHVSTGRGRSRATLLPELHWQKDYITTVVAILGTTISPYLFFWQASQEVEEIKRVAADKPLRSAPAQAQRTCAACGSTRSSAWAFRISSRSS